ncbi:MAG: type IV pilus assembly protein PilC [Candidatus Azotimanducaceae bacterium]|jgi:type IV pilus assembly protein PilC
MLFSYKAIDQNNASRKGTVEATNIDAAISTVQKRGYTVISIDPIEEKSAFYNIEIDWFQNVSNKEIVILSRQLATLFDAQVSALRIFRLLGAEAENPQLGSILNGIADDLQAGSSISRALAAQPDVFSSFYVNMVRSGEESGSLEKSFGYLADYLDRTYQIVTKARNALIYPAFVIGVFVLVMGLMLTLVIPRISQILIDSGQELPIYTKLVIGLSNVLTDYVGVLFIVGAFVGVGLWKFKQTPVGMRAFDELKISFPFVGDLFQKLYLTRICDNLATMLGSGISMVQALEVTAEVVDNAVYRDIVQNTLIEVKGGRSFADAISEYNEIPGVLAQMAKVGEETGNLSEILTTLAKFYQREVNNAVDTLIGLIEPLMIVLLGLGVGTLLASVLMPIYNLTGAV